MSYEDQRTEECAAVSEQFLDPVNLRRQADEAEARHAIFGPRLTVGEIYRIANALERLAKLEQLLRDAGLALIGYGRPSHEDKAAVVQQIKDVLDVEEMSKHER